MSEEFEIASSGSKIRVTVQPTEGEDSAKAANADREKKAKLAYDEILALGKAQVDVMQAFRTRANVLLTIATGTAAILSFSDEVQNGAFASARFFTFWAGVLGVVIAAFCVLALYMPVKWKENPGGVAGMGVVKSHWSAVTGRFSENGPAEKSAALDAIRSDSASYVMLLEEWGEYHRHNYQYNDALLVRMGALTRVAIVGVIVLVVAWLCNGYGLPDIPKSPERIIVQLEE